MNPIFKYFLLIIFILVACDHGIDPGEPESTSTTANPTGIRGKIFYQNWPPLDSLYNLKLVIFKNYPPGDIVGEVTGGNAIAYPEVLDENLPYFQDSTGYTIELAAGTYEYIAVAQQYGPGLFFDWQAVGQYDTTLQDTIPTAITVIQDSMFSNINIHVDFDSLPGQPF
ncbi:hypothetical protein ACFLSX_03210 [Calditrichota bacterium]